MRRVRLLCDPPRARSLLCSERRHVSGDGFGICLGKCMIHRQHRRTAGALPGLLKHQDLMAHISGMLARHPWNHPIGPAVRPVARAARRPPLSGKPWRKITSPRASEIPMSACMAQARKIVGQLGNLSFGQMRQSPHVKAVWFQRYVHGFGSRSVATENTRFAARQLQKPRQNSPPVSPWHSEQTLSAMAIPDRVDVCWGVSSLVPVQSMSVARQKARA